MRVYDGYVVLDSCRGCVTSDVGRTKFHCHDNALVTAVWKNRRAGRKDWKVVVSNHHFHVIYDRR